MKETMLLSLRIDQTRSGDLDLPASPAARFGNSRGHLLCRSLGLRDSRLGYRALLREKLRLLAVLDELPVVIDYPARVAAVAHLTAMKPQHLVAPPLDGF